MICISDIYMYIGCEYNRYESIEGIQSNYDAGEAYILSCYAAMTSYNRFKQERL